MTARSRSVASSAAIPSISRSCRINRHAIAQRFPIGNGIITVDTEAQAWERARVEEQDKGGDAARAALALIGIKQRFGKR
jgi:6,7-dimethyl-8-ribityllumazine synthase